MYTIESIERMARTHDCRVLLVADEAKEVEPYLRTREIWYPLHCSQPAFFLAISSIGLTAP
jgi:hypothetical protein